MDITRHFLHSEINVLYYKNQGKQIGFIFIMFIYRNPITCISDKYIAITWHCTCLNSKLHVREERDKWNQRSFNFIKITGITFRVEVKHKVPGKKKKTKRSKETIRGTRKEVCDVCRTKTKSGHVRCKLCGQWKHVKCVGKTFTELRKEGYKCLRCKGT